MLENFIYAKEKLLFEDALNNGKVLNEAIVFIEDTKEIWNRGSYFCGATGGLNKISGLLNIKDPYAVKEALDSIVENGGMKTFIITDGNYPLSNTVYIDDLQNFVDLLYRGNDNALKYLLDTNEAYYKYLGTWYSQNISEQVKLPKVNLTTAKVGDLVTIIRYEFTSDEFYSKFVNFNTITNNNPLFQAYKVSQGFNGKSDGEFIQHLISNGTIHSCPVNPQKDSSVPPVPLAIDGKVIFYTAQITPNTLNVFSGEFWTGNMEAPGIYSYVTSGRPEGTDDVFIGYVSPNGAQMLVSTTNPENTYFRNSINDSWRRVGVGKNVGGTGEVFNDYVNNTAHSDHAHAEGQNCHAYSYNAHAEGFLTRAGHNAHSEGSNTHALGMNSHAEGDNTSANSYNAHSEGYATNAGWNAHAEGSETTASGQNSHSEGLGTVAEGNSSHAEGMYNTIDNSLIHAIGIGISKDDRKNAHSVTYDGKHYIYGIGGYDGTNVANSKDLATVFNNVFKVEDPNGVIDRWNEVTEFLNNIPEGDALDGLITALDTGLANLEEKHTQEINAVNEEISKVKNGTTTVGKATNANHANSADNATNLTSKPVFSTVDQATKIQVTVGGQTSDAFTVPYATSANTATKLANNNAPVNAGNSFTPVYFNGGVPTNCSISRQGNRWDALSLIDAAGYTHLGKILAFNTSDTNNLADVVVTARDTNDSDGSGLNIGGTTIARGKFAQHSGFVCSNTADLSSYWGKLWSGLWNVKQNDLDITIYIHSSYMNKRGIVHIKVRFEVTKNEDGTYTEGSHGIYINQIIGNLTLSSFRLYYKCDINASNGAITNGQIELWCNVGSRWGVYNAVLLSATGRASKESTECYGTFYDNTFTTVQTPTLPNYVELTNVIINQTSAKAQVADKAYNADNAKLLQITNVTSNNKDFPILWSGSDTLNTEQVNSSVYRSYNDLSYNPSTKTLKTGEVVLGGTYNVKTEIEKKSNVIDVTALFTLDGTIVGLTHDTLCKATLYAQGTGGDGSIPIRFYPSGSLRDGIGINPSVGYLVAEAISEVGSTIDVDKRIATITIDSTGVTCAAVETRSVEL